MDVDIDTAPSFNPKTIFPTWARAALMKDGKLSPHPVGVYPQNIPVDPVSGLAALPYEAAEDLGYLKVDMLHLNVYEHFKSRAEIEQLLKIEPDWSLLQHPEVWPQLFQLARHGELLQKVKPSCLLEVADVMALIRPGKKTLVGLYQKDRDLCRRALYAKDDEGYSFKKSHAIAYAYVVWLQLHLISSGRL